MSAFLELKKINFNFSGRETIVKDFSYTLERGQTALWVGPSGFGKSTLGKLIAGHLTPVSGEIYFDGRRLVGAGPNCFYVGTENDLFTWKRLKDQLVFLQTNVDYPRMLKISEVMQLAEKFEIAHLLEKYPSQISTGEMRRFQILRTIMINSKLMIFDETFSALDLKLKNRLFPILLECWKNHGSTVIIISHESDKNFNYKFDRLSEFAEREPEIDK